MSFSNILGQETSVWLFKRALREGKLAHAYLLTGPDGVGKRSLAKEVVKALNCQGTHIQIETRNSRHETGENWPCDSCRECRLIESGQYADVTVLTPENKTLKIEVIRHLQQEVALKPYESRFRVAIIQGADQLTPDAAHAFLKTLEEPPQGVFFFLTTQYRERVLATIQSRCQIVSLNAIPKEILEWKMIPSSVIPLAQGSFGRAGYWMDPEVSERRKKILSGLFASHPLAEIVEKASSKEEERPLMEERLLLLQSGLRDLIVWKKTKDEALLIHRDYQEQISHFASRFEISILEDKIISLEQLTQGLDRNANLKLTRAVLELELADLEKTK